MNGRPFDKLGANESMGDEAKTKNPCLPSVQDDILHCVLLLCLLHLHVMMIVSKE